MDENDKKLDASSSNVVQPIFWPGITAYVYLIAKMQYTQIQDLRVEDQDVKFN